MPFKNLYQIKTACHSKTVFNIPTKIRLHPAQITWRDPRQVGLVTTNLIVTMYLLLNQIINLFFTFLFSHR